MNLHKPFLAAFSIAVTAVTIVACGSDEEVSAPVTETTSAPPIAQTDWIKENFSTAPYLAQWASVNAQAYRPDNGDGVPLPDDAADSDVVWQMPACVVVPYTGAGPTRSNVSRDVITVEGWDHSQAGAVAAAHGLFVTSGDSKDQEAAVAHATGLSSQEAQRIIATTTQFAATKPSFNDSPQAQCSATVARPTAWKVIDYSDASAVIDFFSPLSDDQTGAVVRVSVEWKNGDWKLNPATFSAFDRAISDLSETNGKGRRVSIEEFTQW